jgi:hypothetical protein
MFGMVYGFWLFRKKRIEKEEAKEALLYELQTIMNHH